MSTEADRSDKAGGAASPTTSSGPSSSSALPIAGTRSIPGARGTGGVPRGDSDDKAGQDGDDEDDGEEIDPNEFDLMVSRSLTSNVAILEPESMEQSMLRGPRRYSVGSAHRRRRASGEDLEAGRRKARAVTFASEDLTATERTPLLGRTAGDSREGETEETSLPRPDEVEEGSSPTKPSSPFRNGLSVGRFWMVFTVVMWTYFTACFDGTIMASSHPAITSYFGASNQASWLSTAFLLTSTAFQPLVGRLSDTMGRKKPFLVTMGIFLFATVWCALAGSMTSLILARAACGLGAGGMMTLGSIIISDMVPIEIRGTYQSILNMVYGVSSMLGAALGGVMVDSLGWRWEFGVQAPVILGCWAVAAYAIPSDLGLHGREREEFWEALGAFDFAGSLTMALAVTCLILGLSLGGNILPWSHPYVIASLVIFAIFFPIFLWIERHAKRPIMPIHLVWKSPHMNMIFANHIASFLVNAINFNIPLFFQAVLLTSATTSGLRLIIPSLVSSVAGAATGFLISWSRRLKWPLVGGTSCLLIGTLCLSSMQRGWPTVFYLLCLVPSSTGIGLQFPGTFMALLAVSTQRDQAVVTSTLILWRSLGNVLGISVSSLLVQNALWHYLEEFVQGPDRESVIERVRESVEAIKGLEGVYQEQVVESYAAALRLTFLFCAVLATFSCALIWPIRLPRLGARKE